MSERINVTSQVVDISENSTYIELVNRLCYYGLPNRNNVALPVESAEEKAQTLLNMPVVAKYKVGADGKPNLGGHECRINPVTNEIVFGTENVGTHISVEVKDDTVDIDGVSKTVPCLFAKTRIWARNHNVVAAIKRLFAEGRLRNSWEIITSADTYTDGIRYLTDYAFEACALLGTNNPPAFGDTASALALASDSNPETIISEALIEDIENRQEEEKVEEVTIDTIAEDTQVVEESVSELEPAIDVETEIVQSGLTDRDIRNQLDVLCGETIREEGWGCVAFVFPEDHIAWYHLCNAESELEYYEFPYSVDGEDVTVGEPTIVRLYASPRDFNSTLQDAKDEIARLSEEVAKYKPYYDKHQEDLIAQQRSELIEHAIKSTLISEAELTECADVAAAIEAIDRVSINNIIAERWLKRVETAQARTAEVASPIVEKAAITVDKEQNTFVAAYVRGNKKGQ